MVSQKGVLCFVESVKLIDSILSNAESPIRDTRSEINGREIVTFLRVQFDRKYPINHLTLPIFQRLFHVLSRILSIIVRNVPLNVPVFHITCRSANPKNIRRFHWFTDENPTKKSLKKYYKFDVIHSRLTYLRFPITNKRTKTKQRYR
jgi:hypothetical protein